MQILTGIAASGLFVTLFMGQKTSLSGDVGPANASIAGYSMIMGSLICLWFTSFYLVNKETMTASVWQTIISIVALSMPVILTLASVAGLLSLNIIYKERINKGRVSNDYSQFRGISLFLLVLQLGLTLSYLKDKISQVTTSSKIYQILSSQVSLVSYLVAIINYIILGVMLISIKYMSTDG
jgi:hypothetical protein